MPSFNDEVLTHAPGWPWLQIHCWENVVRCDQRERGEDEEENVAGFALFSNAKIEEATVPYPCWLNSTYASVIAAPAGIFNPVHRHPPTVKPAPPGRPA